MASLATIERAQQSVKQLQAEVTAQNKARRASLQSQNIPDVASDLKPYATLAGSTKALELDPSEGYEYKTRELAIGPLVDTDHYEFHRSPSSAKPRRRSSILKQSSRRTSVVKQPAKKAWEGEDLTSSERLFAFIADQFKPVMTRVTEQDTLARGMLSVKRIAAGLDKAECPFQEAALELLEKVNGGGKIDYADWLSACKAKGLRVINKERGIKEPSNPAVELPKTPRPTKLDFDTIKETRQHFARTKQAIKERKQEVFYEQTVQQLERVKVAQVKSPQGRHNLERAYMAYAQDKIAAKRALKKSLKRA
eukprot:TRINITY_DN10435_c0_g1_i2.p1 TRINITY_DN10435_c0_g1~~TRINITY_DN10435_c0_g1_i2.p1  ORF type:complete len:309 (+),score=60.92 TRINITY_DN10435_c0_g1_i2:68-994(+)